MAPIAKVELPLTRSSLVESIWCHCHIDRSRYVMTSIGWLFLFFPCFVSVLLFE